MPLRTLLSTFALSLWVLAQSAHAQLAEPEIFTVQTLREAHAEGLRSTRLVMVYVSRGGRCPDTKAMDDRTWKSRTVEGFVKWHAVAVRVEMGMYPSIDRILKQPPLGRTGGFDAIVYRAPGVVYFANGKYVGHVSTHEAKGAVGLPMPGGPSGFGNNRTAHYPGPLGVLLTASFVLDALAAREPVWYEMHKHKNPAPQPPPRDDPWHTVEDEIAPSVGDPDESEPPSALARLAKAREMVRSGDLHGATGMYTWLWERGATLDPAFAAARRSVLAEEMRELARLRPGAGERFRQIRSSMEKRFLWLEFHELAELFTLSSVINEDHAVLEHLDAAVNDPDEAAMLPASDALAYRLMSLRVDYAAAWELPADPLDRVSRICAQLERAAPRSVTLESWSEAQAFARRWALEEGCRIFAACLVHGRDQQAMAVADRLMNRLDDGHTRRTLVTTALAADPPQARRLMERWLAEAEARDGRVPGGTDLKNRLVLALAAREHPDADR